MLCSLYNTMTNQVVSICIAGSVTLWNTSNGMKVFDFKDTHEGSEVTCACFDSSMRRLLTGAKNGTLKVYFLRVSKYDLKMWNFNSGQLLKVFDKGNQDEICDVAYVEVGSEMYVVCTGWDKKISVFLDDTDECLEYPRKVFSTKGTLVNPGYIHYIASHSSKAPR
jgi:WD40 repeat protein